MAKTEKIKEIDESDWGTAMKRKFRNFPRGLASSWNLASLRAWKILAHSFDFSFPPHSRNRASLASSEKLVFPRPFYISINKYKFFFLTQEKHFTTAFRCVSNKNIARKEEKGQAQPGKAKTNELTWAAREVNGGNNKAALGSGLSWLLNDLQGSLGNSR